MPPPVPIEESPVPPLMDRLAAGLVVLIAIGFVVFLLQVDPDPKGYGTHEKFGWQECGWVLHYGKPCPTCGVTTAACHLVHLQPHRALAAQPFGAVLAGFGLWLAFVAARSLVLRTSFAEYLARLPQVRIFVWGLVLLLGSWIYVYVTFEK